jgi:hypothetical protein
MKNMRNDKNIMKIMKFKKFISYFNLRESLKEVELNQILDKISKKMKLTYGEESFLGKFGKVKDDDLKDYKMLSMQSTFDKINDLINNNKKVICDLYDKYGKIGIQIISIYNDYENEICILELKNSEKIDLKDNYLYNIIYNIQKDSYSLQAEDEFFEKIPVKNED